MILKHKIACKSVKGIFCRENAKARTSTILQTLTTRSTSRWLDIMANIHCESVQGSYIWAFSSSGLHFVTGTVLEMVLSA